MAAFITPSTFSWARRSDSRSRYPAFGSRERDSTDVVGILAAPEGRQEIVERERFDGFERRGRHAGNADAKGFEPRFFEAPDPQERVRIIDPEHAQLMEILAFGRRQPARLQRRYARHAAPPLDVDADRPRFAHGEQDEIAGVRDVEVQVAIEHRLPSARP